MTVQILEKRTSEAMWYDIDCSDILLSGETITGTPQVSTEQAGLGIGTVVVNTAAITYSDGRVAAIGKVIQVLLSLGTIPTGKTEQVYTLRAKFGTSVTGNQREATVLLRVKDKVD